MNRQTQRFTVPGPAGLLEVAVDDPADAPRGVALLLHPLPTHGGTMDNKVVQTLVRAALQLGYRAVRLNFRGVGRSEGVFDHGVGEVEDALAVAIAQREAGLPFLLAGFSFGAFVATKVAERLAADGAAVDRLALVGLA
ncbi:MAG: alpha/beta hydrolase, partial [Inhella sp.]|nr:alpha/beta hydrolase [Inhella sp.]